MTHKIFSTYCTHGVIWEEGLHCNLKDHFFADCYRCPRESTCEEYLPHGFKPLFNWLKKQSNLHPIYSRDTNAIHILNPIPSDVLESFIDWCKANGFLYVMKRDVIFSDVTREHLIGNISYRIERKPFKNHRECSNFRMTVDPLTPAGYDGVCRFSPSCNKGHNLRHAPVNAFDCNDFDEGECVITDINTGDKFGQEFFPDSWNIDRFKEASND